MQQAGTVISSVTPAVTTGVGVRMGGLRLSARTGRVWRGGWRGSSPGPAWAGATDTGARRKEQFKGRGSVFDQCGCFVLAGARVQASGRGVGGDGRARLV